MKNPALAFLALFFTFLFLFALPSYGHVILQPDFEGTVMITSPTGEIILIEPGETIPKIPTNAMIEVFDGRISITTDGGDAVKVSCLGHQGTAKNGAAVALSCSENSGIFSTLKGSVPLIDQNGKEIILKEGARYPIAVQKQAIETAPPTAAGEPTGGTPLGGNLGDAPTVDSRSIESSPAQ